MLAKCGSLDAPGVHRVHRVAVSCFTPSACTSPMSCSRFLSHEYRVGGRPPPVTLALRGIVEAKWRPPLRETDPFILPSLLTGPGLPQRERPRWPRPRWRATSVQPLFQSTCKTERSKFNIVRRPLLAGPFLHVVFSQKSRFHFSPTYAHTCTHLCLI